MHSYSKLTIIRLLCLTLTWALLICLPSTVLAQSKTSNSQKSGIITVTGTVVDSEGNPVIGAVVLVKGTNTGSAVDIDGKYSIRVDANAALTASLIGYEDATEQVNGRAVIDFVMKDDALLLEEAVAIGYGTQSKLTLTGSVAQTSGAELSKSSSVNLSQGLAGRLSGVIVNNRSGEPGADDAVMYIRGRSTLGDNSPLIIIDGIAGRDEDFSRLTGDEIESINVLKDASAAIYGSRSANGVILVTTKRGKNNEAPVVNFSYDLGLQSPTRLVEMADAVLFTKAYNAELAITGAAPYYNDTQIQHYIDGDDPILYPNTNWFEQIIKPVSAQHKYGVNIQGGSEKVSYFVQYNGQYQDGIYKKSATNYDQNSVRSNIDITVTDAIKLGVSLDARQQHKNYSAFPSDNNGIFYITTKMKPTGAAYYPNGYLRSGTNPAVLVQDKTGYDRSTINTLNTTFTLGLDLTSITEGLTLNGSLAYDIYSKFNKNWNQNWQYYSYDEVTELYEEKTSSYYSSPVLNESQTNSHRTTINTNLNYDRNFDGHHVTGLLGFEQSSYRKDYFTAGIKQYASDILDELFAGSADKDWYTINGNASETARRSFFGRLGYDWNSKYMVQFIARYDGSENFPKANRWGFFPGVSLGWRLSEEPFIRNNFSWLTNLKLRASYGEQGNDKIDAFQYMTTYSYTSKNEYRSKFGDADVNFIIPGAVPNQNVTWEVARTWNIGIDGVVDHGIFGWEIEFFKTHRSNILCTRNASIPYYTGLPSSLPDENIGEVENKGVELQLNHENKALGGELRYRIHGNILYAKNKIIYMDETPWGEGHEYMSLTGKPMGSGLYYHVIGINRTLEDLENYPQMAAATLGDFIYQDVDGDGAITSYDRIRNDLSVVPQLVYGLNFDFQWKNFDFTMLLQGQGLARYYYIALTDPVSGNVEKEMAENAWTLTNTQTNYPRIGSTVSNPNTTPNDFFLKNAAFLRLKNIEIGYSIPKNILFSRLGITNLRFYISGYNLLTFSSLKNVDPETSDSSFQTYPQMRIFNTGVKLTF